ncbi:nitroreductase family protein [Bradyrhizobium sp. Cp5.3]|uniref:nitroreductase family protein n=1 Tax=Bradyrhizobium sp. Cp5.3 TaxID=443598 RepID=UPI000A01265B
MLSNRFGPEAAEPELQDDSPAVHFQLAKRGSIRKFRPEQLQDHVLRRLCALALCAPTKSDLQQRDIIIVGSPILRAEICALLAGGHLGQRWLQDVPNLA